MAAQPSRPWDLSDGLFGKWNPLTYRSLSAAGDERLDLGTSGWIIANAERFVGGGPGVTSRTGDLLPAGDPNPEGWDWKQSGTLEMDCFLCHLPNPNNEARIQAIRKGDFRVASTATLIGTGIVSASNGTFAWNPDAFTAEGELASVSIQDPTNDNCAQCHGLVHTSEEPVALVGCSLDEWQTATTGQVISPDKISASGVNLANKEDLTRSWDIHAERGLECTDCHYSLNNPAYYQADESPGHLQFDPRRLEIGEYLQRPDHNIARGQSAQSTVAPELKGTMRRCESCHDAEPVHDWLPFAARHMEELACESCHIPQLYAPAVQSYDWTVLRADGQPVSSCRGVEGTTGTAQRSGDRFHACAALAPEHRRTVPARPVQSDHRLVSGSMTIRRARGRCGSRTCSQLSSHAMPTRPKCLRRSTQTPTAACPTPSSCSTHRRNRP